MLKGHYVIYKKQLKWPLHVCIFITMKKSVAWLKSVHLFPLERHTKHHCPCFTNNVQLYIDRNGNRDMTSFGFSGTHHTWNVKTCQKPDHSKQNTDKIAMSRR